MATPLSKLDPGQIAQTTYNPDTNTLATSGFLTKQIGNKITKVSFSSTVDDFEHFTDGVKVLTIRVTYLDSSKLDAVSAERI